MKKYLLATMFILPLILLFLYPIRLSARYMPFCVISILIVGWKTLPWAIKAFGMGLLLTASLMMLFLPYDQIHREDYKGLFKQVEKMPQTHQATGLNTAFHYYVGHRPWYVERPYDATAEYLLNMKVLNSQDSVNKQMDQEDIERMKSYGYEMSMPSTRYHAGLLGYNVWKRKGVSGLK